MSTQCTVTFVVLLSVVGGLCAPCSPHTCKLPACLCSGSRIPGGLAPENTPQIVLITLTDAATPELNYTFYTKLFNASKTNPNGCPPTFTAFVSHNYTNYFEVQTLHALGHEIADNSITRRNDSSWWKQANATEWENEVGGQLEILKKWGQIPAEDIKGFRAPYLQNGGDTEFKVLSRTLNFTYDTSLPEFTPPHMWPYTLDFESTQECDFPPCPNASYPGFWEIPITKLVDEKGLCNDLASCVKSDSEWLAYMLLKTNFIQHYTSNRAPFHIPLSAAWFMESNFTLNATRRFFNDLVGLKDVWVVTISQAIEWIRKPTQNIDLMEFEPWKCDKEPPVVCADSAVNTCKYGSHYLYTCTTPCPKHYPDYGNPDGN
ncbi:Hypp2631 [Branchiostoma lanceolatum]|uniref:Hypp2631 protein n=1 Tax=Branchiostoma lanceolatum TaxID=7740 RepID=A0A8J9ZVY8_BRALA|nr:Hypp2631 [Branchiostoma lanceolatum]